jgi:hypothetical protein
MSKTLRREFANNDYYQFYVFDFVLLRPLADMVHSLVQGECLLMLHYTHRPDEEVSSLVWHSHALIPKLRRPYVSREDKNQ